VIKYQPADPTLASAVRTTTDKLAGGRQRALGNIADPEAARGRARIARQRAVATLPETLARFEAAAAAQGTVVHHARDAAAARQIIRDILQRSGARHIVKSKSMATEEVRLREHLEHAGMEVVETDLGEWIVQLAGQTPSHIIVPAVHLRRAEISELLSRVAGRPLGQDTRDLAAFARAHLRAQFLAADAGISGANLMIAETGTLMIVSNEGNARMCTTLPPLHIALVGVEKLVYSWREALDVLAVLPPSATGQAITQYVSFLSGPARPGEAAHDGPREVHVVLLDNGRTPLVGTPAEELLYCIRCGACLNACPVFRTMGGHAYGSIYPGPIGAALTPHLTQGRVGRDLPWASSLCGACREACPVNIQLDDQLIALRAAYPKPAVERLAMAGLVRAAGGEQIRTATRILRVILGGRPVERLPGPLDGWTRGRSLRGVARPRGTLLPRPAAAPVPVDPPADPAPACVPVAPPADPAPPARLPDDPLAAFAVRWESQGGKSMRVRRPGLAAAVRELVGQGPVSADAILTESLDGTATAGPLEAGCGLVWGEAAAIATGSIVLRSGPHTQRRRSLVPPRVVFIVEAQNVHPDLVAAFAALNLLELGPRPTGVTLVSGPSRSSDIENDLVIGVHGPGEAWVILVDG
jgi:L-lactate dehydrogenase complex protein LldF